MASATSEVGAFPSPFSIETPQGCEGWEEMYPYWSLFDEHRKEADENRLWFWNSMHFPLPMRPSTSSRPITTTRRSRAGRTAPLPSRR